MLGWIYCGNFGIDRNVDRAKEYLLEAAAKGYVAAIYLLSRIELSKMHYLKALRLWWQSIKSARHLTISDPASAKLYLLHGKWKLY